MNGQHACGATFVLNISPWKDSINLNLLALLRFFFLIHQGLVMEVAYGDVYHPAVAFTSGPLFMWEERSSLSGDRLHWATDSCRRPSRRALSGSQSLTHPGRTVLRCHSAEGGRRWRRDKERDRESKLCATVAEALSPWQSHPTCSWISNIRWWRRARLEGSPVRERGGGMSLWRRPCLIKFCQRCRRGEWIKPTLGTCH